MCETPLYLCRRTVEPITVDGHLDEPSWTGAEVMTLRLTDTGEVPRFGTEVRALWDDRFLYVAFHCVDADIWANMTEHDAPLWEEEVVEVFLDPDKDGIGYFEIVVNPLNALTDVYVLHDRKGGFKPLRDWDAEGICHAVHVEGDPGTPESEDRSWTVEMAIPFDELVTAPHIPPKNGDTWRANFYRIEQNREGAEYSAWSPTGEINYHHPECFGTLVFSAEPARAR